MRCRVELRRRVRSGSTAIHFAPFTRGSTIKSFRLWRFSIRFRDTFTLSGDNENRVAQLLRITQHQVRVAQIAARPRMQDALTDLEDTLSDQLAALEHAAEDDKFDAEASGEAERERRSWQPMRAA